MTEKPTGAMEKVPDVRDQRGTRGDGSAGLVLLYADRFETLPPAWVLGQKNVVGRDEAADLRVLVNAVSRRHAEITQEHETWILRDLGSRNGTLVNGVRVSEAQLEEDDEIRVGDALLKFVTRSAAAHARYRIDGVMVGGERLFCDGTPLVGGMKMDAIAAHVGRIAPKELSVVLLGESGTGKEVVAREIHRLSGRRGAFCAVNCAAIPGTLLESELFGYRRGAFSGADRDKPGLLRAAHQGTLFLDEIGDMPLESQAKLLRVLQSREVVPLGATSPEKVDVRFVCATHRQLLDLMQRQVFRADLFARLNEDSIRLPPLRERKEDVFALARTFLARHGHPELKPAFQYVVALLHYDWPYNVRELESCVKRSIAVHDGGDLRFEHLPEAVQEAMRDYGQSRPVSLTSPGPSGPARTSVAPSPDELRELLRVHQGNVAAVGKALGKARMQIHRWMKRYSIEADDYRPGHET